MPPSIHPGGELIEWHRDGEPSEIKRECLVSAVRQLAAAAILARHWPKQSGNRQDVALALAGSLVRANFEEAKAEEFIRAVCRAAGDEEANLNYSRHGLNLAVSVD